MLLHVEVTEDHLSGGIPCHPALCPLGLAIRDALASALGEHGEALAARITLWKTVIWFGPGLGDPWEYLPDEARRVIRMTDSEPGIRVQPVAFDLHVPDEVLAAALNDANPRGEP